MLAPVVARYQSRNLPRKFRADAAFANPEIYEYLEAEGFEYAIRLPANDALQRDIEPLLTRPVGRPSNAPSFANPRVRRAEDCPPCLYPFVCHLWIIPNFRAKAPDWRTDSFAEWPVDLPAQHPRHFFNDAQS